MENKKYSCQVCGRPINHLGNCLLCNLKIKNHEPLTPDQNLSDNQEFRELEELRKSLLGEDYYGDRMLLRRKQSGNEKFRKYVIEKYKEKCFFCNRKRGNLHIHHLSYEDRCKFSKIKNEGMKNTQRGIADCDECLKSTPEIFNKCMGSVRLLCWICHKKLHVIMKKSFGQWVPPKNN